MYLFKSTLKTALFGLLITTQSLNLTFADDNGVSASQVDSEGVKLYEDLSDNDKAIIDGLKQILVSLDSKIITGFGSHIPAQKSPDEIFDLLNKAHSLVQKSEYDQIKRSVLLAQIYKTGFINLYKPRGESSRGERDGWSMNYTSDLLNRLISSLNQGLFDEESKASLTNFINGYSLTDSKNLMNAGFPAQATVMEESHRIAVLDAIKNSPTAEDYNYNHEDDDRFKSLDKLIAGIADPGFKEAATLFARSVENNLYDRGVKIANDDDRDFPEYFGREKEVELSLQALLKIEKSHVILTGKAGVGKTTILKMLQFGFLSGKFKLAGGESEKPPIFLELPITDVTNQNDPSVLTNKIKIAQALSEEFGRKIVLFVDEAHISTKMTRNAIKGFLTEAFDGDENPGVHMFFATTSNEAKEFLGDSAFSRRWNQVHVREFDTDEVIELLRVSHLNRWISEHQRDDVGFKGLTDEAYFFAAKYGNLEQPHAANPTGAKELIEATIVQKLRQLEREESLEDFTLDVQDLRDYLKSKLDVPLVPGDPEFEENFARLWSAFEKKYTGNDGLKTAVRETLRGHFANLSPRKMTAALNAGPPGAGKSYLAETISEIFFGDALLTLYGGDYKNGGLELNKLIGSPSGTVGSEEQRSVLTKFFAENPNGGVIVLEEGDYVHQDVYQFLTNMITDRKMTDGLGQEWDTSKYMIMVNTNKGQELMIPKGVNNKMTWEDYEMRRQAITEQRVLSDDSTVEIVKPDVLDQVAQDFFEEVVSSSTTEGDIEVDQELQKQRRRYKFWYTLLPTREDLINAAKYKLQKFISESKLDYGVSFNIDESIIEDLIDIEKFEFEKGYSYIDEQMEVRLYDILTAYYHLVDQTINVDLVPDTIEVDGRNLPTHKLVVTNDEEGNIDEYKLGVTSSPNQNLWGTSREMRERIKKFSRNMRSYLIGHEDSIEETAQRLKLKAVNWSTRIVITKLGTTGNGKTEYFKSMAKALFGSEQDMFTITGLNHKWDLNNYFRPPTGVQGGREETEFEKWFISRRHRGGVILLDELLSFHGLNKVAASEKVDILNELYQLLDEGKLMIGSKIHDASNFVIGITGNAMQEAFANIPDDPSSAKLIEKIKKKITKQVIVKQLNQYGVDAPKVARLGQISVEGPLPADDSKKVGEMKIQSLISSLGNQFDDEMEIIIDPGITDLIVEELTTLELGMRPVIAGLEKIISAPVAAIKFDIFDAVKIEAKLIDGKIKWFANDDEVAMIRESEGELTWEYVKDLSGGMDIVTPQIADLETPEKLLFSDEALEIVKTHELEGHWMVNYLLTGKNDDSDISLIPGEGYLGYVRHKDKTEHDLSGLSTLFNRMIMLQAGHRAVIKLMGLYETGGGDGNLEKKLTDRNDDVSKVITSMNVIISNQLVEGISENSPKSLQTQFKNMINRLTIRMADYIILAGDDSGAFRELSDRLMSERYLGEEELDEFVENFDYTSVAEDKYTLFAQSLVNAINEEVSENTYNGSRDLRFLKTVSNNLFDEITAIAKLKEDNSERIIERIENLRNTVANLDAQIGFGLRCGVLLAE